MPRLAALIALLMLTGCPQRTDVLICRASGVETFRAEAYVNGWVFSDGAWRRGFRSVYRPSLNESCAVTRSVLQ